MRAIVLGGGRGTRLHPLTKLRAKPAVPLFGRYRLIDIPLSNCVNSGINRVSVLTQFNSHSLNRHIGDTYVFDQFSQGSVTLLAAEQTNEAGDWFQGTADAVRKHLNHIHDRDVQHYLVLSGDQLYRMDYHELLDTHLRKKADITVGALPVDREAAKGFGVMHVQKSGRIRTFVEKPQDKATLDRLVTPDKAFEDFGLSAGGKPYLASMGIYVFRAEVLEDQLMNNPEWIDFGKELIPGSLKSHRLQAHLYDGFWEDIGTVRSYYDISIAMTSTNPPFELHDPVRPIFTHLRTLPGSHVEDATIKNAIICAGSRISKATISDSIIGLRGIVHPGARIERSVILGADYFEDENLLGRENPIGIGAGTVLKQAIIDHNARIGNDCVIRGSNRLKDQDGEGFSIRGGVVVIHKDAVIPSGTKIG